MSEWSFLLNSPHLSFFFFIETILKITLKFGSHVLLKIKGEFFPPTWLFHSLVPFLFSDVSVSQYRVKPSKYCTKIKSAPWHQDLYPHLFWGSQQSPMKTDSNPFVRGLSCLVNLYKWLEQLWYFSSNILQDTNLRLGGNYQFKILHA